MKGEGTGFLNLNLGEPKIFKITEEGREKEGESRIFELDYLSKIIFDELLSAGAWSFKRDGPFGKFRQVLDKLTLFFEKCFLL